MTVPPFCKFSGPVCVPPLQLSFLTHRRESEDFFGGQTKPLGMYETSLWPILVFTLYHISLAGFLLTKHNQ